MQPSFSTIGLIGKPKHAGANESLQTILAFLQNRGFRILLEQRVANDLDVSGVEVVTLQDIGRLADLAIVVGGDGNMLGAARELSQYNVGVVGVNRGNLGFLTDIHPEDIESQLQGILNGEYLTEQRFLLEVSVFGEGQVKSTNAAINEAVLHHGNVAHMMEFEVYIDDQFMFSQRSDGLIVATPTGSTAYSLSGGGPILTPNLNALAMVPMFPHTLSSRPIVVDADSRICLKISTDNVKPLQVSCDGHNVLAAHPGDEIRIRKNPYTLRLIHPSSYNYFNVLRTKLGWGSKLY